MKKAVLFSAMGLLATAGQGVSAQEAGRVISSTPLVQQVAVPRQVCNNQPMVIQQPNSGAGAVLGAIAGGAAGNAIGHGSGRAAATILGLVGGAALGNSIEGSGAQYQNVPQCTTQTFYESRTVGYNVVYEYAGREYTAQMAQDPGATVPVQVTPLGSNAYPTAPQAYSGAPVGVIVGGPDGQMPPMMAPPVGYPPYPAYQTYPAYPAYYPRPYYQPWFAPIGLSLNLGYIRHRH